MVVANQEFLDENPAAAALFDAMQLTLADVAGQNDKMNAGENSQPDIEGHVDEWIAANQATWDSWLQAARDAA
jgi:glycine betaine/proline transport system substrate-binding protein